MSGLPYKDYTQPHVDRLNTALDEIEELAELVITEGGAAPLCRRLDRIRASVQRAEIDDKLKFYERPYAPPVQLPLPGLSEEAQAA